MKQHFFYIIIFIMCFHFTNAQETTYKVGYKAIKTYDYSRKEISSNTFLKSTEVKNPYRPILIHIWYPTTESMDANKMSEREYHFTVEDFQQQKPTNELQRDALEQKFLSRVSKVKSNSTILFRRNSLATRDASPMNKSFPLIIHATHVKAQWEYHEILASKGNIVLSVDALDEPNRDVSAARDIDFGVQLLHNFGYSFDKIIGIGSGYGGSNMYSFQMHSSLLDGFISYDGIEHWTSKKDYYKESFPLQYNRKKMNIPYVRFYNHDQRSDSTFVDRIKYADQYLLSIEAPFINHGSFQYPHFINNHLDAKKAIAMEELLHLKTNLTMQFIDFVKGKNKTPIPKEIKGDKRITLRHIPALKVPPTISELKLLMKQLGTVKLKNMIKEQYKKDADFIAYKDLIAIVRTYSFDYNFDAAAPYFEIATAYYPNKQSIYMQLLFTSFYNKNHKVNTKYRALLSKAVKDKKIVLTERDKSNLKRFTLESDKQEQSYK